MGYNPYDYLTDPNNWGFHVGNETAMTPEERISKHNLRPYLEIVDPSWADLNQFEYMNAIDAAERVRAAIHAERESCASGAWNPIETAPKDGTRILVSDGNYVDRAWYAVDVPAYFGLRQTAKDFEGWAYMYDDDRSRHVFLSEPTHWQPLPTPP